MEDLSGGWLGTYWYPGRRLPCRFEATLTHVPRSGQLSGTILDDGRLGMASLGGATTGDAVAFTKVYRSPGLEPVQYEGTVAEDGRSMTGTWVIAPGGPVRLQGTWEMHRSWIELGAESEPAVETEAVATMLVQTASR
jgi:hypothetical protein